MNQISLFEIDNQIAEIEERLSEGEHVTIGIHEVFMSYTGTIWVRREMTEEEMAAEGFNEQGWHQEHFNSVGDALEYIHNLGKRGMKTDVTV